MHVQGNTLVLTGCSAICISRRVTEMCDGKVHEVFASNLLTMEQSNAPVADPLKEVEPQIMENRKSKEIFEPVNREEMTTRPTWLATLFLINIKGT